MGGGGGALGSKGDLAATQNSEHQGMGFGHVWKARVGTAMLHLGGGGVSDSGFVLEVELLGTGKKERWQI